jgi:predicted HTH domain antitoxin
LSRGDADGTVTLEIADDVAEKSTFPDDHVGPRIRLSAAFSLCSRGELSTSQAARLVGMAYADFLEAAGRAKVQLFPLDMEELKEEISRGFTLGRQRVAGDHAGQNQLD